MPDREKWLSEDLWADAFITEKTVVENEVTENENEDDGRENERELKKAERDPYEDELEGLNVIGAV